METRSSLCVEFIILRRNHITVKYMREATPYVKKGSPVSEIGWETPPPESPRLGSVSSEPPSPPAFSLHGDRRYIPLKMCYVTQSMTKLDPENRQFELHSPDARHTVVLRCKDSATAQGWFSAVQSNAIDSVAKVIAEVKEQIGRTGIAGSREIRHLGWLAKKLEHEKQCWKPVLVVVTEKDLLLYDSMPRMKEAWYGPAHTYPLLATRLVHSGLGKGSPQPGVKLSFETRTGTRQGIESHLFRAETSKELSEWTRHIVQACHNSAELIKEITTSCTYKNQECRLTIHYEQGFNVSAELQEGALLKPLFNYPFEKLKMSSDDGVRMLFLDFGGKEGEISLNFAGDSEGGVTLALTLPAWGMENRQGLVLLITQQRTLLARHRAHSECTKSRADLCSPRSVARPPLLWIAQRKSDSGFRLVRSEDAHTPSLPYKFSRSFTRM
ncbi:UNVERIFIED_CONTAM: hypothetical protein FKN15_074652 [Acipenser sinensis]